MGATLTLDRIEGNLLIAFTAVFVGIVTERLWRIACIMFYRARSSSKPEDGLYHQQQAVLRNSSSTFATIWSLLQLIWAWKNIGTHAFGRVLPTLLTAVFCLGVFTVAGGFSSSISSGISDEVLLKGTNCAVMHYMTHASGAQRVALPHDAQKIHSAANYAEQCYSPDSSRVSDSAGVFDCRYFAKDHLPSTVDNEAPCPFSEGICRSNDSNIRLDTGYLSLLNDLGVNGPPDQDIHFRAVLHCAPLESQDYTQQLYGPSHNLTAYNYGAHVNGSNYTYVFETIESQYNSQAENAFRAEGKNFIVSAQFSQVYQGERYPGFNQVDTIPALFRQDADTTMIFLSGNGVGFFERTNDPWYHATTLGDTKGSPNEDGGEFRVYQPDEAASPMGCTSQYQFCNPSLPSNNCGPLGSLPDAQSQAAPLFGMSTADFEGTGEANGTMISRYQWLVYITGYAATSVSYLINSLGPSALSSPRYLNTGVIGSLPDDQWKTDVKYWWAIYLASLQAGFVDTARGSTDPVLDPYKLLPFNSHVQEMCDNQKIRSAGHVSFSIFGLYFTLVTGLLIITISFTLEPIFKCLYNRRKYQEYTYLEWAASETLQLQRIGFQGTNAGTWTGCTDAVPVTKSGEILPSLALQYSSSNTEIGSEIGKVSTEAKGEMVSTSNSANGERDEDSVSLDDLLDASEYVESDSPRVQAVSAAGHIDHGPQATQ